MIEGAREQISTQHSAGRSRQHSADERTQHTDARHEPARKPGRRHARRRTQQARIPHLGGACYVVLVASVAAAQIGVLQRDDKLFQIRVSVVHRRLQHPATDVSSKPPTAAKTIPEERSELVLVVCKRGQR
eukprot:1724834-Rhodomonas_salina.2